MIPTYWQDGDKRWARAQSTAAATPHVHMNRGSVAAATAATTGNPQQEAV